MGGHGPRHRCRYQHRRTPGGLNAGDDNEVEITVTAEDGTTERTYTVHVDRGSTADYEWNAARDFNTLKAASNDYPSGFWSDGTTMWVSDRTDSKIYAYNASTTARDPDKDWSTSDITANDSTALADFWSDGEIMWIAHRFHGIIYAFNLETKERIPRRDISPRSHGQPVISAIWSDGTTMWVATALINKVNAYSLATGRPDQDQNFNVRDEANTKPSDLWSDGTTMWIIDIDDDKIYAYDIVTREHDTDKDIDDLGENEVAIFGEENVLWTSDSRGAKLFSYNLPDSDDTTLRLVTVDGEAVPRLPSDSAAYMHALPHTTGQVTIEAVARNNYASASISGTDGDAAADGFQVDLDTGTNDVTITVTAADDSTETHTLTLNRGSDDDYAWKAVDDIYSIYSINEPGAGSQGDRALSFGTWTDGTTLWTANAADAALYAYSVSTKERTPDHDFNFGDPQQEETTVPWGMWSDDTTLWLSDNSDDSIHAYDLETGDRDSTKDFTSDTLTGAGNEGPTGIWSDGETMWVADLTDAEIYAYSMETRTRDASKEIFSLASDNTLPYAIWSNGETMWVADGMSTKLFAYSMSDGSGVTASYFPAVDPLDSSARISGITSDGATMWTLDQENNRILSFNMPSPAAPQNLQADENRRGYNSITWEWDAGSPTITKYQYRNSADDGATWTPDWTDIPDCHSDTTEHRVASLTNDTAYKFQLRAVNPRGTSAATEVTTSTTASQRTNNNLSSLTVDGDPAHRFSSSNQSPEHDVGSAATQVTITPTPADGLATWRFTTAENQTQPDANTGIDGFQMDLSEGINTIYIRVTAENGSIRTYTLNINRGSDDPLKWNVLKDFNNLDPDRITGI